MFILIQIIAVLALFFPIKWIVWKITEDWGVPLFLEYQPYMCKKCLGFWTLLGTYLSLGIAFKLWILLGVGLTITALDAIAQVIDEKKKTITLEDYENGEMDGREYQED